jgi:hypothetical protein
MLALLFVALVQVSETSIRPAFEVTRYVNLDCHEVLTELNVLNLALAEASNYEMAK